MARFADLQLDPVVARGLKRGDRSAQATAYRTLAPAVMGMAMRILQDEGIAQEVVQDTFVELIEKAHTLNDPESVVGWVRKVAVNHCLMRIRSPWHKRRVNHEFADDSDVNNGSARIEGMQDIERALGSLAVETRMVIWLHEVEGYTHKEIGKLLGRTASYSKSQLARGYQRLTSLFGESRDDIEDSSSRSARTS
ncbi:MAG: RNA polymerase sigma factor [Gammaproteobacteria bacterium]|nr:RNA polymerase sigma factor [Gammaproteobacteria bacterium]